MGNLNVEDLFTGNGEITKFMRSHFACAKETTDGLQTPLGAFETWSSSLKSAFGILTGSCCPMVLVWQRDRLLFYNDAYFLLLKEGNLYIPLGQSINESWSEDWKHIRFDIEQVFTTGQALQRQNQPFPTHPNGTAREPLYTWSYSVIWSETGQIEGVFATGSEVRPRNLADGSVPWLDVAATDQSYIRPRIDITERNEMAERQQTREILQRREEELHLVMNAIPALIAYVDKDHYYRFNNQTYETWFGQPAISFTGKHVREVLGDAAYAAVLPHMEQAFSGQRVSFESQIAYREGGIRYVQADYVPHINHEGKVEGYFSLVSDISDRKQIEQERERFLSVGSDLLVITGINGYFQWVSPTFERTLGWTVDEMISRPWTDFVHPDDINASILETDHLFSGNETTAFENRYRHKDGSYRWFLWNARPYPKEQVIYGAAVDITERKQAEVTLQVRSAELQHVTETVGVGLARCSRDLRYLSANPAYAQLVETTLEEIVGKLMVDVLGEAALERIRPYCDRVLRGERVEYEPEMVFATGKVRYLHVVYTPDKDSEGNIYRLDRFNHGHHQSQTSRSRTGATLSRPHG